MVESSHDLASKHLEPKVSYTHPLINAFLAAAQKYSQNDTEGSLQLPGITSADVQARTGCAVNDVTLTMARDKF